jgi:outer membrane usher protein
MAVDARQLKPAMIILLCVSTSTWAEPGDDSLPPPPQAQSINGEAVFQLALVLNHYDTGLVVPVTQRDGAYFISSADLLRAGLPPSMCRMGTSICPRFLRCAWSTTALPSGCC